MPLYTTRASSGGAPLEATWMMSTCCGSSGSVSEIRDTFFILLQFAFIFNLRLMFKQIPWFATKADAEFRCHCLYLGLYEITTTIKHCKKLCTTEQMYFLCVFLQKMCIIFCCERIHKLRNLFVAYKITKNHTETLSLHVLLSRLRSPNRTLRLN